jgi:hypothetical protein
VQGCNAVLNTSEKTGNCALRRTKSPAIERFDYQQTLSEFLARNEAPECEKRVPADVIEVGKCAPSLKALAQHCRSCKPKTAPHFKAVQPDNCLRYAAAVTRAVFCAVDFAR